MKKTVENHIEQNVLVVKDFCDFIKFIYLMIGDKKKNLGLQLK